MFERFTTAARGVVIGAQHEARRLNHDFIGTEHLLLALLQPDSGGPYEVLTHAGLDATTARASIERLLAAGPQPDTTPLGDDDAAALEAIGIDLAAIRAKLEEAFGPGALDLPPPRRERRLFGRRRKPLRVGNHLPFTGRAKKSLELSLREAIALQHKSIGAEHLLLGLLREGHGLASIVIRTAGIDPVELRQRTVASLDQAA
jgi:ATP-dependent Clp protease ATP-binding subunit ClpA